jgi:hypothetical protein
MGFDKNVFINCPFDDEYLPLLRPLLFTILYVGLNPRIALESLDSGRPRIDVGCRLFRAGCRSKKCLILEAERYRYQTAISDLSNSDIAVHKNDPQTLVSSVRNWLNNQARLNAPGPSRVWGAFIEFMSDNYDSLTAKGFSSQDIENLPVDELITSMRGWCRKNTNV